MMNDVLLRHQDSVDPNLLKKIPARMAAKRHVVPLALRPDGSALVAFAGEKDQDILDELSILLEAPVVLVQLPQERIAHLIQSHYGFGAEALEESSLIDFVNNLIIRALQDRATDIHLEPYENEISLRFRIDGILHPLPVPAVLAQHQGLLLSRIKVMAQMNIAERRLPQDGRIRFNAAGEEVDIRVSTLPTINGESMDLRLLPKSRTVLGLEKLGMSADHLDSISSIIKKPNGIFLVTGPTGHGKTTTLYAALSQINTPDRKIITVEDPVEIRMKGVNQMQVHSKIGLSFAQGLRSILRQDPDVIMVGEIRDNETAEIAIRSSLTGHLVFSTLHTNDAAGAITRLLDVGVEPYLVASSLNGVLAQRLVRLICPSCQKRGCEVCRFTGFKGRTGIFELLLLNDEIRSLIMQRASAGAISKKAMEQGMRTLYFDGLQKVKAGRTTEDEVLRVTEEL